MRIERIQTIRVNIPFEAPILWSQGYRNSTTRTLVKVYTDDGIEETGAGGEKTPEEMVAFCEKAVAEHGFDCLKLKGGAHDPAHEIRVLRTIRERFGPDFKLRIDPNGCWSPQTAL